MKTLAKFLFSLSLLAGLTACDDDAPTTGEIVLDIEKYMYVQSISIYTKQNLRKPGISLRRRPVVDPAEPRQLPNFDLRIFRLHLPDSSGAHDADRLRPARERSRHLRLTNGRHPRNHAGHGMQSQGRPAHLHRQTSSLHAPAPRSSAAQLLRPAKTNKFALHSA